MKSIESERFQPSLKTFMERMGRIAQTVLLNLSHTSHTKDETLQVLDAVCRSSQFVTCFVDSVDSVDFACLQLRSAHSSTNARALQRCPTHRKTNGRARDSKRCK